jgi:hypothetical protein
MTDNRMHVKFETQKPTKKGTVQETLDIAIADELGTRNYEMYSGGEAFRINFAVRIALSRWLAGRAGAPLPTLIIDEGFGTQDSTGMEENQRGHHLHPGRLREDTGHYPHGRAEGRLPCPHRRDEDGGRLVDNGEVVPFFVFLFFYFPERNQLRDSFFVLCKTSFKKCYSFLESC